MKATRKGSVSAMVADFSSDFGKRFKGRRITKTAFHFFNWAYAYKNPSSRDEMLTRFKAYCERVGEKAKWQNAAEWFAEGTIGRES